MSDDPTEDDVGAAEEPPKKSPLNLIIILVVSVVVLGGGYFGYTQFVKKEAQVTEDGGPEAAKQAPKKKKKTEVSIVYPIEPFIVNLLDKTGLGKRYLKVTIKLELMGEEAKAVAEAQKTRLKDTILMLLSGLAFNEINTIEGKLDLKQSLLSRINQVLGAGVVRRIYFTDFVVQ